MITRILTLFATLYLLVSVSCTNQLSEITAPKIATPVTGLIANYVDSTETVNLTWDNNGQYDHYVLYRTSDSNRVFDSRSSKRVIQANNSCSDVVGLTNGIYFYKIYPLIKDDNGHVIEGSPSNIASSYVGSTISFSINSGDIYIVEDICELCIKDINNSISSVRFSDSVFNKKPVFGLKNPISSVKEDSITKYKWSLPMGAGLKTVYLETTIGSKIDTLIDDIKIQPYKVIIKFRNSMTSENREMLPYPIKTKVNGRTNLVEEYVINKPWVDFSITTFSDYTIDTSFEYWFQTRDSIKLIDKVDNKSITLTTGHLQGKLTGLGVNHNDLFKYRINLSPDSAEKNINSQAATNLKVLYDEKGIQKSSSTATPRENFNRLTLLKYADSFWGRKEFTIVLKMTGRFFNDTRLIYSTPRIGPDGLNISSFDFYPPKLTRDDWSQEHYVVYGDKSEIRESFQIKVDSCFDAAGAKISSLALYITEMSDSLQNNWNSTSITFDMLTKWRSKILPFPTTKDPLLSPVTWNVDISSIPNGWYMFTYVAEDEFGNKGISFLKAPVSYPQSNPYRIKITNGETNR